MVRSLWIPGNEMAGHQYISHMIMPPCFFRRLGDANKCISSMDFQVGYKLPLDYFTSLCRSAQALAWAPQGSKPASCSVQAVTSCPDIVPLPSHLQLLPALAIKAKCAGPVSVGPLFSRQVEKDFLSPSFSFPQH